MTRPRRNERLSSMSPPASESAIGDLEVGWLVQRAAAVTDPLGNPLAQHRQWYVRFSEQPAAASRVAQERERAFLVDESWWLSKEAAEPLRTLRVEMSSRPVTLSTSGGDAH